MNCKELDFPSVFSLQPDHPRLIMKYILALILALFTFSSTAFALDVPPLRGHVNDYAAMLSPAAVQGLEADLTAFERSDSTQIVVLTIPTLEGETLEDFSIKVAEAWRIGQKKIDNGVILLIAKQERKIRIEVGRGLEGKLTDLVSGRIIRGEIAPRFKAGDIDGGIKAGVAAIMAVAKGEYSANPRDIGHRQKEHSPQPFHFHFCHISHGCMHIPRLHVPYPRRSCRSDRSPHYRLSPLSRSGVSSCSSAWGSAVSCLGSS